MLNRVLRNRRPSGTVIFLFLLALILRLGAAIYLPTHMTWRDGRRYDRIAKAILVGEGYGLAKDPPLHPIVLSSVYALSGPSVRAARLVWALLGTGTCLWCYAIAKLLFGKRSATLALGVCAAYPLAVYTSVLPEYPQGLFSFLLTAAVFLAIHVIYVRTGWAITAILGVVLGLGSLTIPAALAFLIAFSGWLLLSRRHPIQTRLLKVCVLVLPCAALVLAWACWHFATTGIFFLISANGGVNFYKGNCELMVKFGDPDAADFLRDRLLEEEFDPAYETYQAVIREAASIRDLPARDRFFLRKGLEFIRENPSTAVGLFVRKFLGYWAPYPRLVGDRLDQVPHVRPRNIVLTGTYLPIAAFALIGVVKLRSRWYDLMPIYLAVASQCLVYTIVHPSVRYRSPVDYLLIVLAAATFCRMFPGNLGTEEHAEHEVLETSK